MPEITIHNPDALGKPLGQYSQITRVKASVSPILEIAAIADRVSKSPAPSLPSESTRKTDRRFAHLGDRALLFESVEGSDIPVLINQFGSYRRMEMALGGALEALAERLGNLIKPEPPPTPTRPAPRPTAAAR